MPIDEEIRSRWQDQGGKKMGKVVLKLLYWGFMTVSYPRGLLVTVHVLLYNQIANAGIFGP